MNRRGFLGAMLKAAVGAAILPAAATYARRWARAKDAPLYVPGYEAWVTDPETGLSLVLERNQIMQRNLVFLREKLGEMPMPRPLAWWWANANFNSTQLVELAEGEGEPCPL